MKCNLKNRIFLIGKDIIREIREDKKRILFFGVFLLLGILLGVYIGIKIGESDPPYSVFAKLFRLDFSPFSYIASGFFRFLLYAIFAALAYFLPIPWIYPAVSIFLFGKYFAQLACIAFLSDSIFAAILSLVLIYLPLLLFGWLLLLRLTSNALESRLCNGPDPCKRSLKSAFICFLTAMILYLLALFLLHLILCGLIYLIAIAI